MNLTGIGVCQLQCATDAFAAEPLVANEDIATLQRLKSIEILAGNQSVQNHFMTLL